MIGGLNQKPPNLPKPKKPKTPKTTTMASSSKIKKPQSNPINLTRLLANDAQHKFFEEHFHGRTIFTPKYDFMFPYLLRQQNLFNCCCESNEIYPELVRVFYCNMNFRKNLLTSHVKGKDIVLDRKTLSSLCCDIPTQGSTTGFGLGYPLCWISQTRRSFAPLFSELCPLTKIFKPLAKKGHRTPIDVRYEVNIKINCSLMIMQQMWHVRSSQSPLPYDIFITNILEHFGVSLDGETKIALNLRESKIDVEVFWKSRLSEKGVAWARVDHLGEWNTGLY
ncbi:hypothetical protein Lal_00013501 [Lupinus albus]|nr:hypothetical protein Lal_00013501 [Lupinus albus]